MRKKGFTLIELLIVVAIIAILAAIAVPNFLEAQVRSKVSRCKADMRSIATAIESYAVDHTKYPPLVAPNADDGDGVNGPSVFYGDVDAAISSRFIWLTTPKAYITSVFRDPFINPNVKFAYDPYGNLSEYYDTYDYVDAPTLWEGGAIGGSRGASGSSGAMWHIVGAGPDRKNAYGGGTTDYSLTVNWMGCDYDPTNGTVSAGDIVRIGGGPGPISDSPLPAWDRVKKEKNF